MKEATGELNGTVIVFMAVAALTAFFFMFLWPLVKSGMYERANCANAVCDNGYITNGEAYGMTYCYNPQDSSKEIFTCPFRG